MGWIRKNLLHFCAIFGLIFVPNLPSYSQEIEGPAYLDLSLACIPAEIIQNEHLSFGYQKGWEGVVDWGGVVGVVEMWRIPSWGLEEVVINLPEGLTCQIMIIQNPKHGTPT